MNSQPAFLATAFVSCSLRQEDKNFIEFIEAVLTSYQIKPFGTVGRYSAAPLNPTESMRINIPQADIIVVVATARYAQQDIHYGNVSAGISEMVHVESGIAFACNKPIVAFVQKGASLGNFLPNVTQYITLDGTQSDFDNKQTLIRDLLNNAYLFSLEAKQKKESVNIKNAIAAGLAFWGGLKIIESISDENKPKRKRQYKTRM